MKKSFKYLICAVLFVASASATVSTANAECWTFAYTCGIPAGVVCADTLAEAIDFHQMVNDALCEDKGAIHPSIN